MFVVVPAVVAIVVVAFSPHRLWKRNNSVRSVRSGVVTPERGPNVALLLLPHLCHGYARTCRAAAKGHIKVTLVYPATPGHAFPGDHPRQRNVFPHDLAT